MSDWYHVKTYYGYEVFIPEGYTCKEFIDNLDGLNSVLEEFKFICIISGLYMDNSYKEIFDTRSDIIIGFDVVDISSMDLVKKLADYVTNNPIMDGIELSDTPRFYSGIDSFITDEDSVEEEDSTDYSNEYDTIP
jgi:hypothetical protein